MECCRNCMHHAPQAENERMCSNEQSPAFGMRTESEDFCMEYGERVNTWNLSEN